MQKINSHWTHAHQQLTLFLVCENVEYEKRKQTHIMPSYLSIDSIKAPNECVQIKSHKHSTCTVYFLVIQSPSLALTIMRTTEIHCLNWFVSVTDSISDTAYSLVNGIRMPPNTSHQPQIVRHQRDPFCMYSTQQRVFKKLHHIHFSSFLQSFQRQ